MKKTNTYRRITALLIACILITGTFCGCGKENDDTTFSNDDVSLEVLNSYFSALEKADYEAMLSVLPPDLIFDDFYQGHILSEDYYNNYHDEWLAGMETLFYYAVEDYYPSVYGNDFHFDCKIQNSETVIIKRNDTVITKETPDGLRIEDWDDYLDWFSSFYSNIFNNHEALEEGRLAYGTATISGSLGRNENIEFCAALLKYDGAWYFLGFSSYYDLDSGCDMYDFEDLDWQTTWEIAN